MHKLPVFLDSSVIITALLSSRGGSYYVLTQLHERFAFQINEYVLAEVQEIIQQKFQDRPQLLSNLFLLLGLAGVLVSTDPSKREVLAAARLISKKDAPILASAMTDSDYLLTLDNEFLKPHIVKKAKEKGLSILKPGDFILLYKR